MSAGSIDLDTVLPQEFAMPQVTTSSASVLRKYTSEIQPYSQTDYAPVDNNIMTFQVADNASFLLGPESYLRWEFYRDDTNNGYDDIVSFDVGGIQACIKTVEIRMLASGMLASRKTRYNLEYALFSIQNDSSPHLRQHGYYEGDSTHDVLETDDEFNHLIRQMKFGLGQGTGDLANLTRDTGVVLFGSDEIAGVLYPWGDALGLLNVGDLMSVRSAAGTNIGYITALTDRLGFTMEGAAGDISASSVTITGMHRIWTANSVSPQRQALASARTLANRQRVVFQLNMPLLFHNLPLFLLKGGIEIRIELENGSRCMKTGTTPSASLVSPSYRINAPRFFAALSTPEPSIIKSWAERWNSPKGLIFYVPETLVRMNTGNSTDTDTTLQFTVGVRSARRMVMLCTPSLIANSNAALARASNSLSTWIRSNIRTFQAKVGSHLFPLHRVEVEQTGIAADVYAREHYFQMMLQSAQLTPATRADPHFWKNNEVNLYYAAHDSNYVFQDAKHFTMNVDFSRSNGPGSALSGIDLSLVPIIFMIERSAAYNANNAPGNPDYIALISYDSFLRMASSQVTKLN